MKIKMSIYVNGLKKEIRREINVNDDILLRDFCEYVIVSLNGKGKHLYQLIHNEEYSYLGPGCYVLRCDLEQCMDDMTLEDLDLMPSDELMLNYDFSTDWEFMIKVESVKRGYFEKEFEVTSGCGQGILEDCWDKEVIKDCINSKLDEHNIRFNSAVFRGFKKFANKTFNVEDINNEIEKYKTVYRELVAHKKYIMDISLKGFEEQVTRKIEIENNVPLDKFCECVIRSMNGKFDKEFYIKKDNKCIDNEIVKEEDLYYLELKENDKLEIVYDNKDNWCFEVTLSKITDEFGRKKCEVLEGKGYGIIEECGGISNLSDALKKNGKSEFDLRDVNRSIDVYF